jgi:hypothetical protein
MSEPSTSIDRRAYGLTATMNRLIADIPAVYSKTREIGCLVSLGTGIPPNLKLGTGRVEFISDIICIATNSDRAHYQVEKFSPMLPRSGNEKYWRFNLSKELSDHDKVIKITKGFLGGTNKEELTYDDVMVKMDSWDEIPLIRELTDNWLSREDTKGGTLETCARRLAMKDKNI